MASDSYLRRNLPFLDRKNTLARLLRNTDAGILFNEHIAEGNFALVLPEEISLRLRAWSTFAASRSVR